MPYNKDRSKKEEQDMTNKKNRYEVITIKGNKMAATLFTGTEEEALVFANWIAKEYAPEENHMVDLFIADGELVKKIK